MEYKLYGAEGIKAYSLAKKDIEEVLNLLRSDKSPEFSSFNLMLAGELREYLTSIASDIEQAYNKGTLIKNIVFVLKDEEKIIGVGKVIKVPMASGVYETAYLIDENHRMKGLGTAVCKLCIEYAFRVLEAHRVESGCYKVNIAGRRILEKFGFTYEGLRRGYYEIGSEVEDRANYGMLLRDFSSFNL